MTRREKIYDLLSQLRKPVTAEEIASMLGLRKGEAKSVETDLEFLMKSVKRRSGGSEIIEMIPARCSSCGYEFRERDKIKKPSRCPRCKSERIQGPWFFLKKKY